jgi:hypothetical protein
MPDPVSATLGSAAIGAGSSLLASNAQSDAAAQALAFQQQVYRQQQKNLKPYLNAGQGALTDLINLRSGAGGWEQFVKSPDYQFRFNEGLGALQNSAAAKGNLLSGNTLRGITNYGQGFAASEFANYWNRLFNQAQMGQSAALGGGQLGNAAAGQIGNTMMGQGQANASGVVGAANSATGAVQNYLMMNALNRSAYAPPPGLTPSMWNSSLPTGSFTGLG